jgi:hypothetical protein
MTPKTGWYLGDVLPPCSIPGRLLVIYTTMLHSLPPRCRGAGLHYISLEGCRLRSPLLLGLDLGLPPLDQIGAGSSSLGSAYLLSIGAGSSTGSLGLGFGTSAAMAFRSALSRSLPSWLRPVYRHPGGPSSQLLMWVLWFQPRWLSAQPPSTLL